MLLGTDQIGQGFPTLLRFHRNHTPGLQIGRGGRGLCRCHQCFHSVGRQRVTQKVAYGAMVQHRIQYGEIRQVQRWRFISIARLQGSVRHRVFSRQ